MLNIAVVFAMVAAVALLDMAVLFFVQYVILKPAELVLAAPSLSPARGPATLATYTTHVPRVNSKKRRGCKRRSSGGGVPATKAKDTPGWFGDGWALLTRQERPKARTLSNRQANRAARREEEKLTRAQEGADGVTLVTVTPGAATHGEKTNLDSTTNNVSDVFNPTSSTNGSDTPTDNTPMLRGSSGSSATTSSTPRVSASGAETNSNPMAATNRYVSKKVSFKDVVVLGSPALDRPRRSLLGRAWRKINKRTGEALDITGAAVTGLFADAGRGLSTAADEFVLTTKTLAHTTQRRMKGAAHKVDKEVSKACTKVVDTAKEAKTVCKGKAGMVMQTFQKFNLFRK